MAVFFAANALWWAYRAGATLARGYLDWEAGRRGTTLEAAFENAKFRRSRGQLNSDEWALIQFVMFNDRWRWTDPKNFALDTSAMLTSGFGLLAKVGLGNRILAVLGVKSAPTAGVLIDGVIDAVGGMLTGGRGGIPGLGDVMQAALEVLRGVQQTDAVKHGTNVVTATVKLGELIQPFLGAPSPLKAITAIPAIIDTVTQLFGAILGLWGAVEELLPEPKPATGTRGAPPQTDPIFRNALAAAKEPPSPPAADPVENLFRGTGPVLDPVRDPGRRGRPPPDAPPPPPDEPEPILDPTRERRRPGGPTPAPMVPPPPVPPPVIDSETRRSFVRRFSNSGGATDLRLILEELKKR